MVGMQPRSLPWVESIATPGMDKQLLPPTKTEMTKGALRQGKGRLQCKGKDGRNSLINRYTTTPEMRSGA